MHPYASDSGNRAKVYWVLALFASSIAATASAILRQYGGYMQLSAWISAPSAFAIFGGLLKIFDRWAWKNGLVRLIFDIQTPNLAGTWSGSLTTSFDNHKTARPAKLIIKQDWSKICVKGEFETSRSQSTTAAVVTAGMADPVLIYGFSNRPDADSVSTMTSHSGTAELYFENKDKSLLGGYFTSRDRQNHGGMKFRREKKKP